MNNDVSFQRLAAITSLIATLLACGSIGFQAVVLNITVDPLSNPGSILEIGANGATLFRWGMILDIFGYYLLLAPLALLLWSRLQPKGMNLITLFTFCGLAFMDHKYLLIGVAVQRRPLSRCQVGEVKGDTRRPIPVSLKHIRTGT
jgi:hypothetical protein